MLKLTSVAFSLEKPQVFEIDQAEIQTKSGRGVFSSYEADRPGRARRRTRPQVAKVVKEADRLKAILAGLEATRAHRQTKKGGKR